MWVIRIIEGGIIVLRIMGFRYFRIWVLLRRGGRGDFIYIYVNRSKFKGNEYSGGVCCGF